MAGAVVAIVGTLLTLVGAAFAYPAFRREREDESRERFRARRRALASRRGEWVASAAGLLPTDHRWADTDYVSPSTWRPDQPVPIDAVTITYVARPKVPRINGRSSSARRVLPIGGRGRRASSYSEVLSADPDLRPSLWWDAPSYDLTRVEVGADRVQLDCTIARYFEMVDVCEAVGHEFVANALRPRWRRGQLPLRAEIGDPFDPARRPFVPSVVCLLLFEGLGSPQPTFLLHSRNQAAVASAGGVKHLFGGQFQPSSKHSMDPAVDADLWRSVARELAEEVLGLPDTDGSAGAALSMTEGPLSGLEALRRAGDLRLWVLGLGMDPLTLWPDILTVAVVDESAFRARFPEVPLSDPEGTKVGRELAGGSIRGFSFTAEEIERVTASSDVHPAAAACLRSAWSHRDVLLGRT